MPKVSKKNAEYWKRRFSILNKASQNYSVEIYKQAEQAFNRAQSEIQKEIDSWITRFMKNNQVSYTEAQKMLEKRELAELRWNVQDYIKHGRENAIDGRWMKELENASAKYHISRLEALKMSTQMSLEKAFGNQTDSIDDLIRKTYAGDYYKSVFELQKGFGVGFEVGRINQNELDLIVKKPWTADEKTFSDRIWAHKKEMTDVLHKEMIRTLVKGETPYEAAKSLTKFVDSKVKNAMKAATCVTYTEHAYFSTLAQQKAFNDLGVEEYEIVATLDDCTCGVCADMDGKHFPMSEFKAGTTAPPFHPRCRTTVVPYFSDNFGGLRAARDEDNNWKTYYVPDNITYKEWEEKYVKSDNSTEQPRQEPYTAKKVSVDKIKDVMANSAGRRNGDKSDLTKPENSGIIHSKSFAPAADIPKAEEYARNVLGIPNVSYNGVDVEVANEWNRGLKDTFDKFPELKKRFGFVGEIHERNKGLKPLVVKYNTDLYKRKFPNVSSPELSSYIDVAVKDFMSKVNVSSKVVAQSFFTDIADYSPYFGVSINSSFGKDTAAFMEGLKKAVNTKKHPVGCTTIRSVLDHEIGHQLDKLLGVRNMPEIQKLFNERNIRQMTDELSEYAWNNKNKNKYAEMIAEAWAEYCNNPNPREIAATIGKTIEEEYKKRFGKR